MKILIVDDNADMRKIMKETLELLYHHETETATSGKEGIEFLKKDKGFNLVITDTDMPDGNGFDVLSAMRDMDYPCHAFLMSGNMDSERTQKALSLGATGVFSKDKVLEFLKELEKEEIDKLK